MGVQPTLMELQNQVGWLGRLEAGLALEWGAPVRLLLLASSLLSLCTQQPLQHSVTPSSPQLGIPSPFGWRAPRLCN